MSALPTAGEVRRIRTAALRDGDRASVELCDVALDQPTTFGGVVELTCTEARMKLADAASPAPKPKLLDDALYLTDNGRVVCGKDAGASARFTGRDISGQRVARVTTKDDAYWLAELGEHISCEQCGKRLPAAERASGASR